VTCHVREIGPELSSIGDAYLDDTRIPGDMKRSALQDGPQCHAESLIRSRVACVGGDTCRIGVHGEAGKCWHVLHQTLGGPRIKCGTQRQDANARSFIDTRANGDCNGAVA
jgi:hypothetical protein